MTANTPRSRKSKGAKFQKEIRDKLLEIFPILEEDDIKTAIMGESGEDIKLSPAARKLIPYAIEAKAQEKVSLRAWWEQAKANAGKHIPLLITKQSRKEPLVIMSLDEFLRMIGDK
ncbi:hypothetical cyanophage protein [Synechococcus phage S-CRM01]|uniref:RusA-like Holliday junction resolvase n=1 Tax=Synechococcus phage S-CRM01 TaxID=1026955 RepID=UPI000209E3AE|nr:RusA-like Holliday junction resolvase [Synechococcus phage S-CRM01]AEC53060.1 hypothetical cyanophage protein [Synechococcus phage S-CRM01]